VLSIVCSTWELPVVCPPMLGLHTMDTGIRCAAGECLSPLASVLVVDAQSRTVLPPGSVGNVWVAVPLSHASLTRGPKVGPLQWLFDPATKTRSGPYRVSGALSSSPPSSSTWQQVAVTNVAGCPPPQIGLRWMLRAAQVHRCSAYAQQVRFVPC
jgi:hypothetical protein